MGGPGRLSPVTVPFVAEWLETRSHRPGEGQILPESLLTLVFQAGTALDSLRRGQTLMYFQKDFLLKSLLTFKKKKMETPGFKVPFITVVTDGSGRSEEGSCAGARPAVRPMSGMQAPREPGRAARPTREVGKENKPVRRLCKPSKGA